ncbi:uncharacterized protein LOC130550829 isoform X2 [Triplophysa rosa]|uniref:uncharacterized protein LOC130550829 isoform X2 n=1 Tax=Triplophysa rosa TaxID=992332 RepID=UPI002545DF90|nr:uncharacterized protein LOC130550829 isoform X2 [Triplophysa rosa]
MKTISLLFIVSLFIYGVFGDADEVKSVSVMEGDSVTLHTELTELQRDDVIEWVIGNKQDVIFKFDRETNKVFSNGTDGRFRDRLQVDDQTGDLTIVNVRSEHTGLYKLEIHSRGVTTKIFNVQGVFGVPDEMKLVSVMERDSVTLHTDVPLIKNYDVICWRFENSPLVELDRKTAVVPEYNAYDERFRDRLHMDHRTGFLIISNITTDLSGLYEVKITNSRTHTIHQSFRITVSDAIKSVSVMEDDSVTLYTDTDIQTYYLIQWMFGGEGTWIAKVLKADKLFTVYNGDNEIFRNRLKLKGETGSLTITNMTTEDSGEYRMNISSRRRSIHRRYTVNVREPDWSSGEMVGLCILFQNVIPAGIAAAIIGVGAVIYFCLVSICKISDQRKLVGKESVSVMKGDSVTLHTDDIDIQRDDQIEWCFEDRLELDVQTGSLTITNMKTEDSGLYEVKISTSRGKSYSLFTVSVIDGERPVKLGDSVTLYTGVTKIQTNDLILWTFTAENNLIAQFTRGALYYSYTDDGFRDRLQLNHNTGSLTITDITTQHSGLYEVHIYSNRETKNRKYNVTIYVKAEKGKSVTLHTEAEIQRGDWVKWTSEKKKKLTLVTGMNGERNDTIYTDNKRMKGRLEMNPETGDLTITNIRQKDEGVYTLKHIHSDGRISYRTFSVYVNCDVKSVMEGDSVNLDTDVPELQSDDLIEWLFGDKKVIAKFSRKDDTFLSHADVLDGRFRDRLQVDDQTGSLTITNITTEHSGLYHLRISTRGTQEKSRFRVIVSKYSRKQRN